MADRVPPLTPTRPQSAAFLAYQRGAEKLAHAAKVSKIPFVRQQPKWRTPNTETSTEQLVRVFHGYATRWGLGLQREERKRRSAPDTDIYTTEALRRHWESAGQCFAAAEFPITLSSALPDTDTLIANDSARAFTPAASMDPIAWLANPSSLPEPAAIAVAQSWMDIVQHDRVHTLMRNLTARCGISNVEARLVIKELSELAVSGVFDTVNFGKLTFATSRSDEKHILEALQMTTTSIAWSDDLFYGWKHVLPLLSKPLVRSDV